MELELGFRLQNADSYETEDCSILVSIDDVAAKYLAQNLQKKVECNELEDFIRRLLSNPAFDGSDAEGLVISEAAQKLCDRAFEDLGWADVMATLSSIKIGKSNLNLDDDEVQVLLTETLALQLVQDDKAIYFCN